jgi:antitoxin ParD1/3/4
MERMMTAKANTREEMSEQQRALWAKFDVEIQKGVDDVKAGRVKDADEVFDRLEAKYRAMNHRRG